VAKRLEEEDARKRAEEKAKREAEEEAKMLTEEERKRKEEEEKKLAEEEEEKRRKEKEEEKRRKEKEEEEKRKWEEEEKRKWEKEEEKRLAAKMARKQEEERKRKEEEEREEKRKKVRDEEIAKLDAEIFRLHDEKADLEQILEKGPENIKEIRDKIKDKEDEIDEKGGLLNILVTQRVREKREAEEEERKLEEELNRLSLEKSVIQREIEELKRGLAIKRKLEEETQEIRGKIMEKKIHLERLIGIQKNVEEERRRKEKEKEEVAIIEEEKKIEPTVWSNDIDLILPKGGIQIRVKKKWWQTTTEVEAIKRRYKNLLLTILFICKSKELSYFISSPNVHEQYSDTNWLKIHIFPLFAPDERKVELFRGLTVMPMTLAEFIPTIQTEIIFPRDFLKLIFTYLLLNCKTPQVFRDDRGVFCDSKQNIIKCFQRYDPRNFFSYYKHERSDWTVINSLKIGTYDMYSDRKELRNIEDIMNINHRRMASRNTNLYFGAYVVIEIEEKVHHPLQGVNFGEFVRSFNKFRYNDEAYKLIAFIVRGEDFTTFLESEDKIGYWLRYYFDGDKLKYEEETTYDEHIYPYMLLYKIYDDTTMSCKNLTFIDPYSQDFPPDIRTLLRNIPGTEEKKLSDRPYTVGGKKKVGGNNNSVNDTVTSENVLLAIIIVMLILIIYYIVESVNIIRNAHTMRKELEWRKRSASYHDYHDYPTVSYVDEPADYTIAV
jgi:acyl transferase domain-containing protein